MCFADGCSTEAPAFQSPDRVRPRELAVPGATRGRVGSWRLDVEQGGLPPPAAHAHPNYSSQVEKCILWLVHLPHLQLEYTLFIYYVYFMQKQGPDPLS